MIVEIYNQDFKSKACLALNLKKVMAAIETDSSAHPKDSTYILILENGTKMFTTSEIEFPVNWIQDFVFEPDSTCFKKSWINPEYIVYARENSGDLNGETGLKIYCLNNIEIISKTKFKDTIVL